MARCSATRCGPNWADTRGAGGSACLWRGRLRPRPPARLSWLPPQCSLTGGGVEDPDFRGRGFGRSVRRGAGGRTEAAAPGRGTVRMRRPRMSEAGVRAVVDAASLAVVGLIEVVGHIPRVWREYRKLLKARARGTAGARHPDRQPRFPPAPGASSEADGNPGGVPGGAAGVAWRKGRLPAMRPVDRPPVVHLPVRGSVLPAARRSGDLHRPSAFQAGPADAEQGSVSSGSTAWPRTGRWWRCCRVRGGTRRGGTCRRCWRRRPGFGNKLRVNLALGAAGGPVYGLGF